MQPLVFWPYDELQLRKADAAAEIVIETPWLQLSVAVAPEQTVQADMLVQKFADGSLGPADLPLLNWFLAPLQSYPLCYTLPRRHWADATDQAKLQDTQLWSLPPAQLLAFCAQSLETEDAQAFAEVSHDPVFADHWQWDVDTALQFAKSGDGIDPVALFTVGRRFHLLSAAECDATLELYQFVKQLPKGDPLFQRASALMVRQNHYVTQQCDAALRPALNLAGQSAEAVRNFIKAEYGHDRILDVAMRSMVDEPEAIEVTPQVRTLMALLRFAAGRNLLAFALAVDFFERSAYQEADPLATVLKEGGLETAAKQINRHMDINDAGEHENVAAGFLRHLQPVDAHYAIEAMRLAEAITHVMNRVSSGVLQLLKAT